MPFRVLVYSVVDRTGSGGAQTVIARLLTSLRRRGHVVTAAWPGPAPRPVPGEWVCPLHVRPASGAVPSRGRKYHLPSLVRLAAGLIRFRPQIVNVHFVSEQALYFLRLGGLFGYKTVLSAHGTDVLKPAPAWRDLLPDFLGRADAVTVVSQNLAERVLSYPGVDPARVHVIPNGIDCGFWSPGGGGPPVPPMAVAVGRLEPVKGFDLLLRAFAAVRGAVPDARLCIVGDGRLAGELTAQAGALGLGGAVELPGRLDRESVRDRLRRASVFVLSSRSEGMPLALLEAMACGVPPVATRVGGVPEVVAGGAGLLVPPGDADALAAALVRVLRDPGLAAELGQAAHRRAQAFSSASSEAAYERLYESLLRT
jgi:glycosyltransferase involved in cell wall biosynthesis